MMDALRVEDLVFRVKVPASVERVLLNQISFQTPFSRLLGIIGPSGCGKSTLIKILGGLHHPSGGTVSLQDVQAFVMREKMPLAMGYLPQFAAFHSDLSVLEVLSNAAWLRLPSNLSASQMQDWIHRIAALAGLESQLGQTVKTLSGGQQRRLALAEELLGDPAYLFLDELTSGLDPHSERSMMQWLSQLAKETGKTIVIVTHAVTNLHLCDQVVLLNAGHLMYDGAPDGLNAYFGQACIEDVYEKIDQFGPWQCNPVPPSAENTSASPIRAIKPPGALSQLPTLLSRQAKLLWRDRGQLWLHLMLLISFPLLVAVFALNGLPEVQRLSTKIQTSVLESLSERLQFLSESFQVSSLVAGLSMFQVILLTLMGANNAAREIAKERRILSKELRSGLSPLAYLSSKVGLVTLFSLLQAGWMTVLVKTVCGFPGEMHHQFSVLFLATMAMSCTCLWFSSISRTPEKASLLSIYLVGLQLPLSGAVLALPEWLKWMTRPFIAAYWGWSGYLRTFEDYRHFDIVKQTTKTDIANFNFSVIVLSAHIILSLALSYMAIHRLRRVIEE